VPLGIKLGIEASSQMRKIANKRGVEVIDGVAEELPFIDEQFDFALMVTTICFLDDIETAFKEAYRILKPDGKFIIGFIDSTAHHVCYRDWAWVCSLFVFLTGQVYY